MMKVEDFFRIWLTNSEIGSLKFNLELLNEEYGVLVQKIKLKKASND